MNRGWSPDRGRDLKWSPDRGKDLKWSPDRGRDMKRSSSPRGTSPVPVYPMTSSYNIPPSQVYITTPTN